MKQRTILLMLLVAASPATAQPAVHLFGGVGTVVAQNGSDEFGLPTDGHGLSSTLGVAVSDENDKLWLSVEADLARTITSEVPGVIKSGPITYVIMQRPWVGSILFGRALVLGRQARLLPVGGVSVVGNEPSIRYSFQTSPTLQTTGQHFAWSGGLDLLLQSSSVVLRLPRVRVHYITGVEREFNGFGAPRILWNVGATVGWRF